MTDSVTDSLPLAPEDSNKLRLCLEALDDRKAEEVKLLDVRGQSSITDFLVIATGNSPPHLRALRVAAEGVLKDSGSEIHGVDNMPESGWLVVDAFDIMVHLFTTEMRDNYRLETLWKDAKPISL